MNSIPKPPSRPNRKGPPPAETDVPGALFPAADAPAPEPKAPAANKRDTPFNFRVAKDLKRRFNLRAFDLEVGSVDLFEAMIDLYLDDDRLAETVQARKRARTR